METSCLHSGLVFFSISKLQYRNSNSYFNLLLLLSGDTSLNPGPLHNNQLQPQSEWSVFNTLIICYLKSTNLEILLSYLMQQLWVLVNKN